VSGLALEVAVVQAPAATARAGMGIAASLSNSTLACNAVAAGTPDTGGPAAVADGCGLHSLA